MTHPIRRAPAWAVGFPVIHAGAYEGDAVVTNKLVVVVMGHAGAYENDAVVANKQVAVVVKKS